MAIESTCSGCGKHLSVADEHAGKQARCPACGQVYQIPVAASFDSMNDPSGLAETSAGVPDSGSVANETAKQYWMQAPTGDAYGPVDRTNLDRWFSEGRVGPGYRIRESETGEWLNADVFRPRATSGNPYATNFSGSGAAPGTGYRQPAYAKPDQGGMILAFGIVSFVVCPIFGIVAWVMGHSALKDIAAGRADPKGKGLVQVGYWLGIVSVILNVLCIGGYLVMVAVVIVAEAAN